MSFFSIFLAILFYIVVTVSSTDASYEGCFAESVRVRHFNVNPGSYNPEALTVDHCRQACSEYSYAATTQGKFCFCSDSLPGAGPVGDPSCDMPCSGDALAKCGSTRFVSVYKTLIPISGFKVSSDVSGVVIAPTTVTLSFTIEHGANVVYAADYDDGSGYTQYNETGLATRTLYVPGAYHVMAKANDASMVLTNKYSATSFTLEDVVQDIEVLCDPVFVTYEEGECMVTVWRGTNLELTAVVDLKPTNDISISPIADPEMAMVGAWAPVSSAPSGPLDKLVLLHASQFSSEGKIYGWRALVEQAGTVDIMILAPNCGTNYCYESNTCKGSCFTSTPAMSYRCPGSFCGQSTTCTTCTALPDRFDGSGDITVDSYVVRTTVTLTFTGVGDQWLDQAPLDVYPGEILAIQMTTGNGVVMNQANAGSDQDLAPPTTSPVLTRGSGLMGTGTRVLLQAFVSYGAKVFLRYIFTGDTGIFPLTVTVRNRNYGPGVTTYYNATAIDLQEGVDKAWIISPGLYLPTTEGQLFYLEPHTGNALNYDWNVTDGSPQTNLENLTHTFTTPGTYNVSVAVYNAISSKENYTTVIVQDKVTGLNITGADAEVNTAVTFSITVTAGTDYNCSLNFQDNSPLVMTNSTVTTLGVTNNVHTFIRTGVYLVEIVCENEVSFATASVEIRVDETILGLTLVETGAPLKTDFRLTWTLTSGTDVTFALYFNDASVAVDLAASDPTNYEWASVVLPGLSGGSYSYNITATNSLGSEFISGQFVIKEPIVNPTMSADRFNVTTDDTVTFTVDMTSGPGVTVTVAYGDGSPDDVFPPASPSDPWSAPLVFTHDFINGCNCAVTATISNAAGSFTRIVTVVVNVGFSQITWGLPAQDYYLYTPPADVNFQFTSASGAIPTDPLIEIDWGDGGPVEKSNTILFGPPGYSREYGDTEDYILTVRMSNALGSKTFTHKVIVVETLEGPQIDFEFPSAPLNQPFGVIFKLYRGDQDELTTIEWDFGDGNPSIQTPRQGVGENGADTAYVTYTTLGSKTITVTATAPKTQIVSATKTVNVIQPVIESAVVVTSSDNLVIGDTATFTVQYNDSPMPTNAFITVDFYNDGIDTQTVPFSIALNGGTQDITFAYTRDGLHTAVVSVHNDASVVKVNKTVGVYRTFTSLSVVVTYQPDSPPANPAPKVGLNGNGNFYPSDKPVIFTVTDSNNAFATSYTLDWTSGATTGTQTFTSNVFTYQFNDSGSYSLQVTATNPLDSITKSLTIQVVKRVIGMTIQEKKAVVMPGQLKGFRFTFVDSGVDTCVYIDWDDNGYQTKYGDDMSQCNDPGYSTAVDDGTMSDFLSGVVGHRYLSQGLYTMTVTAVNGFGMEVQSVTFPISYYQCSKPVLTIHNAEERYYKATQHQQDKPVSILGLAVIDCPDNLNNVKSWTLERIIVNGDGTTTEIAVDMTGLVSDKAELYIPARHLSQNLYKATYRMAMDDGLQSSAMFTSSTYTYFEVVSSDLLGVMVEGGMTEMSVGRGQRIQLNPLTWSLDPNIDSTLAQGITVSGWDCEVLSTIGSGTACTHFSPSGPTQDVDASVFANGTKLKVKALLQKDTRTAEADIQILISGLDPPAAHIRCVPGSVCYQRSDGYMALQTSRISLECYCSDCTGNAIREWTIFIPDYRWPQGWRPLKETDISERSISSKPAGCDGEGPISDQCVFSVELGLESELFQYFSSKADLFKARCSISDNGINTTSSTNIYINQPPEGGNCTVSPLDDVATPEGDKLWQITCTDWNDIDGISEFRFFSVFNETEVEREVTSYRTSRSAISLNVSLPVGPAYRDYYQDLYVVVKDVFNAAATLKFAEVRVTPPNNENIENYLEAVLRNPDHSFFNVFQEGDQSSVTEKGGAMSTLLTYQALSDRKTYAGYRVGDNNINTGYGAFDEDRPNPFIEVSADRDREIQYEYDKRRNDRARLRTEMSRFAIDLSYEDIGSVQQVAALYAAITSEPGEITSENMNLTMAAQEKMIANLADSEKMINTPQEDIQKAMHFINSALGCVVQAADMNYNYPTLQEMAIAHQDPSWYIYDTSLSALGTNPDITRAKSYEEAEELHTRNVHRAIYKAQAEYMAIQTYKLLDLTASMFNSFAIPGQVQATSSYRMRQTMQKNFVENILKSKIQINSSQASVTFPSSVDDMFPDLYVTSEDIIVAQVSELTSFPTWKSTMGPLAEASFTHFLNVDLYDESGQTLVVDRTTQRIRVEIAHDVDHTPVENKLVQPFVTSWNRFQLHSTETLGPGATIHMDFVVNPGTQLVVVVNFEVVPDPETNQTDFVYLVPPTVPPEPSVQYPYRIVMTREEVKDRVGTWRIGTRERATADINKPVPTNAEMTDRYKSGAGAFEHNYYLKIWTSGCFYSSPRQAHGWAYEGCEVSKESNVHTTVCYCNHLTTFASGFIVAPNTIDWNFVFANASFLSNPTLYLTEIFIFLVFVVAFVFARKKDKADSQKLGLAPLLDNDPRDKYFYEVTVSTGMRRNAGTNSNVFFILSGDEDETDVRMFSDSKRPIFKRGMTNGFLMSVPECLGKINYIRVWHDNSGNGKFGSWFLNYIAVRDLQTDTKQVFIANRWLALEEDDGQVDRIIPVAGREQLTDFSYTFGERSKKNLSDGHLWFSVVARPPGSRFTCVQRVACCLCLLFMTMLTNAMFYNTEGSTTTSNSTSFNFGPFSLSAEQIFIGFISTIIVFPINFFLVFLFRRSRPRNKRISRVQLAFMDSKPENSRPGTAKLSQVKPQIRSDSSLSEQMPSHSRTAQPSTSNTDLSKDEDRLVRSTTPLGSSPTPSDQRTEHDFKKSNSEQGCCTRKLELPWWCVRVAWALLILCTVSSAALVTFYGITFTDSTCKKWVASLILSFFTSVFITQPLKVILMAIFLSLIIKNPGEEEDEEEVDEEQYSIADNDLFLHSAFESNLARPQKIGYKPVPPQKLEELRQKRLKEVQMWAVVREVLFYCIFIWVLLVISHRNRSAVNFRYKDTMVRTFIISQDTDINFEKIRNKDEFWIWAKSGFLNGIMANPYYNLYPALRLRAYINDKASRILGHAVIRQLRIQPGKCSVPHDLQQLIRECNEKYTITDQEQGTFAVGWKPLDPSLNGNDSRPEYKWTTAAELNGYPYWGQLGIYSGGGYTAHLTGTRENIREIFTRLESENWIDQYTRAVFLEFTVYNPQVNLFSINTLLAEFHTSNGVVPSYRFEPAMLLSYVDSAMVFHIICEITFLLFIIVFTVMELFRLKRQKLKYFTLFWNWIELIIIVFSITAVVVFFYRLVETNSLTKKLKQSQGNDYIKFQYVGYWNEIFAYMIGVIVFFSTLKFLKLLRFNRRISMLSNTIKHGGKSLFCFSMIFWIVFMAFCQLFYLMYMTVDEDYSSFSETVVACILMMMGKFNIYGMIMAEPILTQICVLLYVVSVTFIIVNMFVSILNDTFTRVRDDVTKQGNEYEILDFMMNRFMKWTGIGGAYNEANTLDGKTPPGVEGFVRDEENRRYEDEEMSEFPSRIDKLLAKLSNLYKSSDHNGLTGVEAWGKKPYEAPPAPPRSHMVASSSNAFGQMRRTSLARVDTL